MLTSFFYKMRNTSKIPPILSHVLSNYSTGKYFLDGNIFRNCHFRSNTMKNIGLIMSVIKIQSLNYCLLYQNRPWFHILLEVEIPSRKYKVSPLIFTHFRCFMCRYYYKNTQQCLTSLRNLQQSTWEEIFALNREDMATSYSSLGIVLQLLGDYDGSREAFQQARYDDMANFPWKTESAY